MKDCKDIIYIIVAFLMTIMICVIAFEDLDGEISAREIESSITEAPVVTSETTTEVMTEARTTEEATSVTRVHLGEFRITAYCSCAECCGIWASKRPNGIVYGASGEELIANYSIAVDPEVIPYGTKVYFNDNEYIAHDCGGAIKENRIDLYFNSHREAIEWGVQYHEVYMEVN